eukprot:1152171-Pelagomonas_calceolata.AAC.7
MTSSMLEGLQQERVLMEGRPLDRETVLILRKAGEMTGGTTGLLGSPSLRTSKGGHWDACTPLLYAWYRPEVAQASFLAAQNDPTQG